ncbi:MAG: twin-arginine translocation signal domain-containing protein [Myxococcales bacterium]
MTWEQESTAVRRDFHRGLAVAGAALGVGQHQCMGDGLVEGHQTSGGWASSGPV